MNQHVPERSADEAEVEQACIEAGKVAPRVTPEMVDDAIEKSEFTLLQDGRTTICLLTLDNGFTVRGESSCVSRENYDPGIGQRVAYDNARSNVWPLLGFRLADQLAGRHAKRDPSSRTRADDHRVRREGDAAYLGSDRAVVADQTASERARTNAIYDAARIAHEVNRAYCESLGDASQKPWFESPEWQVVNACKGMEAVANNPEITPEQLHESWSREKIADGWVYGDVKDAEAKTHPCLVPYDQLPAFQRTKDSLFRAVALAALKL